MFKVYLPQVPAARVYVYELLTGWKYLRNVHGIWQELVAHVLKLLITQRELCADRQVPLAIVNADYNLHALVNYMPVS